MTIAVGEMLTATIYVADDVGDPVEGLAPETIASTNPIGADFGVTYEDAGGGAYYIVSDEAAMLVGTYTLVVNVNDSVVPGESQLFSVTWDTGGESVVITGVQRVQYVVVPHPADPDGTHDSRYLKLEDVGEIPAGFATTDYVDDGLALKADQTALDTVAGDVAAILVDTTDMATETWVGTQISGLAESADVATDIAAEASARSTADAGKVDDFTQYYTQTVSMGNGVDTILTTELSVQFCVPEAMTLHSAEIWGDVSGDITMSTSRAPAGSASFSLIHAAAPLALAAAQVATPALTGWTVSLGQFDKIRTTVGVNAVTITRIWVCYRFTKARS